MDRNKLIALIVEKTGIKLDPDDPAFVLVELNKISLEEAAEKIAVDLNNAANKFERTTTQNVDNFVDVANEALSKFIQKTKELTAAIDAVKTSPKEVKHDSESKKNEPSSSRPAWLIPVLMFCCFFAGTIFGVSLTLFAQK